MELTPGGAARGSRSGTSRTGRATRPAPGSHRSWGTGPPRVGRRRRTASPSADARRTGPGRPPAPAEVTDLPPTLADALAPFDARPHWGKRFADADRHVADLYPRISDFRVLAEWLDPYGKFRNDYLERHRLV